MYAEIALDNIKPADSTTSSTNDTPLPNNAEPATNTLHGGPPSYATSITLRDNTVLYNAAISPTLAPAQHGMARPLVSLDGAVYDVSDLHIPDGNVAVRMRETEGYYVDAQIDQLESALASPPPAYVRPCPNHLEEIVAANWSMRRDTGM